MPGVKFRQIGVLGGDIFVNADHVMHVVQYQRSDQSQLTFVDGKTVDVAGAPKSVSEELWGSDTPLI